MQEFDTTATEKDQIAMEQAFSSLLRGYGVVSPKQKPEDFSQVRKVVEKGIARDVISEASSALFMLFH